MQCPVGADDITVNPPVGAPTAPFSADVVNGVAPLTVTFTAVASGTVEGWQWNFGDGKTAITGLAVQHTYTTPGVFDVRLTVSNTHGRYMATRIAYIHITTAQRVYLPLVWRTSVLAAQQR